jgi:hypothetical protein
VTSASRSGGAGRHEGTPVSATALPGDWCAAGAARPRAARPGAARPGASGHVPAGARIHPAARP